MNIYYFCSSATPSVDYWILAALKQKDVDVTTVDLKELLIPNLLSIEEHIEEYPYDFCFDNIDDLIEFCDNKISENDIVFMPTYKKYLHEIRERLARKNVKIVCDTSFGLPAVNRVKEVNSKLRKFHTYREINGFTNTVKAIINVRVDRFKIKLRNLFSTKKVDLSYKKETLRKLKENTYIIVSGEKSHFSFQSVNGAMNHIKIPHSSIAAHLNESNYSNDRYIVFVDQAIPYHRDVKRRGYDYVSYAKRYYEEVRNFLIQVQEDFPDKEVVVALHPRSAHANANYGKVKCIKGITDQLIKESYFIVTHFSTSIYSAIYFRKPIVFLTTELIDIHYDNIYMHTFHDLIGGQLLSSKDKVDADIKIDCRRYQEFQESYILQSDTNTSIKAVDIIVKKLRITE